MGWSWDGTGRGVFQSGKAAKRPARASIKCPIVALRDA
jgi:hypothetical protein